MFGTAGVRKMPLDEQEQLLTAARHTLARSGFLFKPSWARTLSGVDEGVYGWIAVNYMAGTLNLSEGDDEDSSSSSIDASSDSSGTANDDGTPPPPPPNSRLGTLDLGGSSLEVCVDTTSLDNSNNYNDTLDINVLDTKYQLYCHVHQGYGLNDAFDRGVSLLLAEELLKKKRKTDTGGTRSGTLDDGTEGSGKKMEPPLPPIEPPIYNVTTSTNDGKKGTRRVVLSAGKGKDDTSTSTQSMIKVHHPCLQQGYSETYERLLATSITYASDQLEMHKHIGTVLLAGAPDYIKCQELAAVVVNATAPCTLSQHVSNKKAKCALGAMQPAIPVSTKLKALTGFHVVQNFYAPLVASITQKEKGGGGEGGKKGEKEKKADVPTTTLTQEEIDRAGRTFCSQSWDQVMKHHPGELQVEHYCFRVPYINNLLTKGLGLGWSQVEIDGTGSAGWTLGAALTEGVALAGLPTHVNNNINDRGIGAVNSNNNKPSWVVWNVEAMVWVGCLVGIAAAVVLYTKRREIGVAVIVGDNMTNNNSSGGLNGSVSSLGGGRSGPGGGGIGGGGNVPLFGGARVPSSQTLLPRRGSFLA